jgi:hypothetical protein
MGNDTVISIAMGEQSIVSKSDGTAKKLSKKLYERLEAPSVTRSWITDELKTAHC